MKYLYGYKTHGKIKLKEFIFYRWFYIFLSQFVINFLHLFVAIFWALFDQTGSTWVLQAQNLDRNWLGINWLPSQIQAINPIMILIFVPFFSYFLYPKLNSLFELTPLKKICIGLFIAVPSFLIIGYLQGQIDAGLKPSISWQVLAYAILTASEVFVSITCLEFSYTQAPNSLKSFIMGFNRVCNKL